MPSVMIVRKMLLAATFMIASTRGAMACSCGPISVKRSVKWADAVFLGTIEKVVLLDPHDRGSRVIVQFEVERAWKGPVTKRFEMRSIIETTFCEGFWPDDVVVGKKLLVFANRTRVGSTESYSTNICTPTGAAEERKDMLKALGKGRLPD